MQDELREKRLRRLARSCGLRLIRSPAWSPRAADYGTYALMDPVRNCLELASPENGYGMSLEDIERFLDSIHLAVEGHFGEAR